MKLFKKFPWLFFALAIVLVLNNIFKFDSAQVLEPPMNIIVPAVFTLIGAVAYFWKWYENKNH